MTPRVVRGTPASPGAAVGPAWTRSGDVAGHGGGGAPDTEAAAARRGLELAADELGHLAEALRGEGHGGDAEIVEANQLMAQDQTLLDAAEREALAGASAPEAIARAIEPHAQALADLDDPLLAARAADLHAIARRAGELSTGRSSEPPAGVVVIADDLGPGEVAAWSGNLAAIVLAGGGTTAHAAIVARSLGIPLVTGAGPGVLAAGAGDEIGVDADRGMVWLRPDDDTSTRLRERAARVAERAERDRRERRQPARTGDGRTIRLLANAGTEAEVRAALEAGAEGIGLLRSELAFLEAAAWPAEDEHVAALRPMLDQLGHRIATVRTLDFGGDKTPPFLADATGGALGPRGIRLALASADGIAPQLRALFRVSGDAVLRVLVPMVTDPAEIEAVRAIANEARDAVAPGAPDPMVGAMIEVPAAALMARRLAEACDFLSIGTNDLTQYALAADRQHPGAFRAVAHHPAVLRLIARTIAAAHSAGILVDVCGEAAGDPELLPLLVALGVDELSVSPARIAQTRRYVRNLTTQRAKAALVDALAARTADEVGAAARATVDGALLEGLEQPGDGVERL
ncbi:MAG TPA: putative PEP-binding protein [Gaiellales bacterium]|nr:putative PEP-binding protein [Gaiellales bacterium]